MDLSHCYLEKSLVLTIVVLISGTVDEHFAKALGKQTWKQIQYQSEETEAEHSRSSDSSSVDEHFTKALGADTWQRIKQDMTSSSSSGHVSDHEHLHRASYYRVAPPSVQ